MTLSGSYQSRTEPLINHDWGGFRATLEGRIAPSVLDELTGGPSGERSRFDQDGWRFLLPVHDRTAHIAVLDCRLGITASALRETCDHLTCIHPEPALLDAARAYAALLGHPNLEVRIMPRDARHWRLPFPDESLDGFVFHDTNAALARQCRHPPVPDDALLGEVARVLKPGGFAYFGLRRPHRPATRGLRLVRRHPYLIERGQVSHVLPPPGYRSFKNSFTWRERAKEVIYGRWTAPVLAPACGYLLRKGETVAGPSLIEAVLRQAAEASGATPAAWPMVWQYQVLGGKIIVTTEERVVVVPRVRRMLEGRQRDVANQIVLREHYPTLRPWLPEVNQEVIVRGEHCFALSTLPGITLDLHRPRLVATVTARAAAWLTALHGNQRRVVCVDRSLLDRWITPWFGEFRKNYPALAPLVADLPEAIAHHLEGKPLPVVCFHGDYKIENLMLDRRTLAIRGVIDWEHALRDGPPLLDLWFLLAYNRIAAGGGNGFFGFCAALSNSDLLEKPEADLIQTYLRRLEIPATLQAPLHALFFIHHVAVRNLHDLGRQSTLDAMRQGIHRIRQALDQGSGQCPLHREPLR